MPKKHCQEVLKMEFLVSQGKTVLVDEIDQDLSQFKWCYHFIHSDNYYVERRVNGDVTYLRRIILERILGHPIDPGFVVDHINGDGLDNRRSNIRMVTAQQNQWNKRKSTKPTTSIYKGVSKLKSGKCVARIKINGILKYVGTFNSEIDAAHAYDNAASNMFGKYANTNF